MVSTPVPDPDRTGCGVVFCTGLYLSFWVVRLLEGCRYAYKHNIYRHIFRHRHKPVAG